MSQAPFAGFYRLSPLLLLFLLLLPVLSAFCVLDAVTDEELQLCLSFKFLINKYIFKRNSGWILRDLPLHLLNPPSKGTQSQYLWRVELWVVGRRLSRRE